MVGVFERDTIQLTVVQTCGHNAVHTAWYGSRLPCLSSAEPDHPHLEREQIEGTSSRDW